MAGRERKLGVGTWGFLERESSNWWEGFGADAVVVEILRAREREREGSFVGPTGKLRGTGEGL